MTRIGRILLLAVAVTLFLFAVPTFASNVTVGGTVNFSSLDGSVDDDDHVVNGVFTVSGEAVGPFMMRSSPMVKVIPHRGLRQRLDGWNGRHFL